MRYLIEYAGIPMAKENSSIQVSQDYRRPFSNCKPWWKKYMDFFIWNT